MSVSSVLHTAAWLNKWVYKLWQYVWMMAFRIPKCTIADKQRSRGEKSTPALCLTDYGLILSNLYLEMKTPSSRTNNLFSRQHYIWDWTKQNLIKLSLGGERRAISTFIWGWHNQLLFEDGIIDNTEWTDVDIMSTYCIQVLSIHTPHIHTHSHAIWRLWTNRTKSGLCQK